ncbi:MULTISPECIES: AAA family ATPase [Actinomycetes]
MQAFLLLKQTIDSSFDPGAILLHGPNVKFTDASQTLSRERSRATQSASFTVGLASGDFDRTISYTTSDDGFVISHDIASGPGRSMNLYPGMPATKVAEYEPYLNALGRAFINNSLESEYEYEVDVLRSTCFLDLSLTLISKDSKVRAPLKTPVVDNDTAQWSQLLRGIIHVPGLRGNPERQYPRSAVGSTYIGTFETYVASIIHEWSNRAPSLVTSLAHDLEVLGLTWKIKAQKINDASVELLVGRTPRAQRGGAQDLVSVADVGFGVSQALPVLVSLLAARVGQIVYLEQPEIHLHPRAQVALAAPLVAAANRGVRVVIETHSSLLIRSIQTEIALGSLPPSAVSMNWFSRDPETGFSRVDVAELDEAGRFGDWPVDFDEISQDADIDYLKAIGARR